MPKRARIPEERRGAARAADADLSAAASGKAPLPEEPLFDPQREADRLVWQRFAHAGMILNDNLDILHFRGDANRFISPASGNASLNALRILTDELKMALRSLIDRARRTNVTVRSPHLLVRRNGAIREVVLEAAPINPPDGKERYFLVLFDESGRPGPEPEKPSPAGGGRRSESRGLAQLRRELEASREYLQSVVEQRESANEAILSGNEELRSANEELKTATEELQTTNEELVRLNDTLQIRNAELAKLSDDLRNVLDRSNIPILIVGGDGIIRRFTPSAGRLLKLLPSDVGRPIDSIRANVELPDLAAICAQEGWDLADSEREVQDRDGRWYSLRIRPYLAAENRVDGALLAFFDIDALKRANRAAIENGAMVRGLVETLLQAVLVIDQTGAIQLVNASAERIFGYSRAEMLGKPVEMLLPERLRAAHAQRRAGYFDEMRIRLMGEGKEIRGRRKNGQEFPIEVSLNHVQSQDKRLAVASIRDLTSQRETEAALVEKENALRRSEERLQTFTANLLTTHEEERARLAADLHDDLNQRLAALAIKAGKLEAQIPDSHGDVRKQIGDFRLLVEGASEDVRRMAHQLHPSILAHFGLPKALASYCQEFSALHRIQVHYRRRGVPDQIPDDVALCLYRVVQEALANTAKHSGAEVAFVLLVGGGGHVRLVVKDAGRGFDRAVAGSGLGFIGMRERVRLVGGTLSIKSKPGDGALIEVSVPLGGAPA